MPRLTEEQKVARLDFIGGSDADSIHNFPPYGCERALVATKANVPPDFPLDEDDPRLERGTELEPVFAAKYERLHGARMFMPKDHLATRDWSTPEGQAIQDRLPWARATLDRVARLPDGTTVLVEIKSAWAIPFKEIRENGPANHMLAQVQWGLGVTGQRRADLFVGWPDGWEFLTFPVVRDDALIESMLGRAAELWPLVMEARRVRESGGDVWSVLPPALPAKAPQCSTCTYRASCKGAEILAAEKDAVKDAVDLSGDQVFVAAAKEYLINKAVAKQAEDRAEKFKALLQERMTGAKAVVATCRGFRAVWRPHDEKRFDGRLHERERPECHQAYRRTQKRRDFRTYNV